MKIEIKEYVTQFKEDIVKLILEIQQEEFQIPITLEAQPDLKAIESFYQKNNGNFWVALVDGKIAGTIALIDIGKNQGALRKMFVKKEYRGKEIGVAQKLLDHLIHYSEQKEFSAIYLGTTEKFIAAQKFYEKNRFIEVAKENLPKEFPVMSVDVKFYKLKLN